jgi:hypothetical protein
MIETGEKIWITFLRRHGKACALIVLAAVLAVIGAVLTLLWFVGNAQTSGLVPRVLSLWTLANVVFFILNLIFWEILFIGIPAIVFVVLLYYLWWKKLPAEERKEYKRKRLFGKRSRGRNSGSAFTFLINIVFVIKVYVDGNWNVPVATWTFNYLVYSYLLAFIIVVAIFGIPFAIGALWWIRHQMKKAP